ncbi:MAG: pyridoxal-phosphate dependent enzyme, partial [Terriglobia bacterium]
LTAHCFPATAATPTRPLAAESYLLDDFVLVSDEEINDAIRLLAQHAKQVAEGAGAASLTAAIKLRDQLHGKKVVGILTGGNIPLERFAATLSDSVSR